MKVQRSVSDVETTAAVSSASPRSRSGGTSMLQRWPCPFRVSAWRITRVVTPRPTPVSTTTLGRNRRTTDQVARAGQDRRRPNRRTCRGPTGGAVARTCPRAPARPRRTLRLRRLRFARLSRRARLRPNAHPARMLALPSGGHDARRSGRVLARMPRGDRARTPLRLEAHA